MAGDAPTAPQCAWLAWLLWQGGLAEAGAADAGWAVRPAEAAVLRADWLADAIERISRYRRALSGGCALTIGSDPHPGPST